MTITQAVLSRRSIRQFLPTPVDAATLRRVLTTAQRAPSGGNLQPWNAELLTGEPLARLIATVLPEVFKGRAGMTPEYTIYPEALADPYEARRTGVGEAMYEALGIPREDKPARLAQFVANYRGFDAPVLMLIHTPRTMGPPQWSDMGMWLQTVMLLLREEGLDSCAQEAWSAYGGAVRQAVSIPDDHVFFCGLAIGYRDPAAPVNQFDVPRAPLDEVIRFHGF